MSDEIKQEEDEISLIDLFAVLWRWKIMIIVITFLAAIGVVIYAVISIKLPPEKSYRPNVYTPKALMLINNTNSSGGGSLSSMLNSSGLGGMAALAGVRLPSGSSFSALAEYLVGTNSLLDSVVDEFDLITKYKIKKSPKARSRKRVKSSLKAAYESRSGVFSIAFTNRDPVFAQQVVNYCVDYLENRFNELGLDKNKLEKENLEKNIQNTYEEIQNLELETQRLEQSVQRGFSGATMPSISMELNRISLELRAQQQVYTQLKTQYELLKVSMASESPMFQVLELAEIPDQKSGPNRGKLCMMVTLGAGFGSVFLAFVLNAILNLRKDPEAMAKLRRKKA
ncbi:Wzz/FepE/Etk N-terminal domain-containing protein [Treponema primitia]|uniref:Wzz/FepE/Etk N-terminal domain-containing protein n=1 Tax=Treponema primitia TaxID=88058 RepID=UPI0002555461|nr:Wzz/FepE/Etk N-terminal domain-containing protein [Treponema primitia]